MLFGKQRLGIDLGTTNTVIAIENKGIALREPSMIAVDKHSQEVIAYGNEAMQLAGRTSDRYDIIYPLKAGVISQLELTKQMLSYFIKKSLRRSFAKPEVVICIPSNITKLERRAVINAVRELGILRAMIVDEPFAAAIGANVDIEKANGRLICDIGGGTTDVAVISYGEIIHSHTSYIAGIQITEAIQDMIRSKYHKSVPFDQAEIVKHQLGNALITPDNSESMLVNGKDKVTGDPQSFEVYANDIAYALMPIIKQMMDAIRIVLEGTEPELCSDILDTGMIITGGGALLRNLDEYIQQETGLAVHLAPTPLDSVAIGAMKMLNQMDHYSKHLERQRR